MSIVEVEEVSTVEDEVIDSGSVVYDQEIDNEDSGSTTESTWLSYAAFFVLGLVVAFAINLVLHVIQWNIEDAERAARTLEMMNYYKSIGVKF